VHSGRVQPRGAVSDDDPLVRRPVGWHVLAALRVHRFDPRGGVPRNGQPCRETPLAGFDTADRQLSENLRTAVGGLDGALLKVGPDGTPLPEAPPYGLDAVLSPAVVAGR
jgi:hypothetical protein